MNYGKLMQINRGSAIFEVRGRSELRPQLSGTLLPTGNRTSLCTQETDLLNRGIELGTHYLQYVIF